MLTPRSGLALLAAAAAMTSSTASAGPLSLFGSKNEKKPAASQKQAPPAHAAPAGQSGESYNQRIAEQIAAELKAARLSGYNIQIEFKDGVAGLNGSVSDAEQRARAAQIVKRIPGVMQVQNNLRVESRATDITSDGRSAPTGILDPARGVFQRKVEPAPQPVAAAPQMLPPAAVTPVLAPPQSPSSAKPATGKPRSNQQVADDIARSLKSARLNGYDIEIHFQNGVATLNGSVNDPQQIAQATQVVSQVNGVQHVDNRLRPQNPMAQRSGPQAATPRPMPVPVPLPVGNRQIMPVAYQPGMGEPGMPPMAVPPGAIPPGAMPPAAMPPYMGMGMSGPAIPPPPGYGHPGQGQSHTVYNMPQLPDYAWPTYAAYPNSAQISYPTEYSASAWPYIGPFYPYPQVPLGWRKAQLEWDDGYWNLTFNPRTDKWFWFMNPKYW